jgi:hypothetical protein
MMTRNKESRRMNQVSTLQTVEHETTDQPRHQSFVSRLVSSFVSTLVWAFLLALVIGASIAALWTVIPTEMLEWGSSQMNLIGYVSHCNFAPASTGILAIAALFGVFLINRLDLRRDIGFAMLVGMGLGGISSIIGDIGGEIFLSSLIGMSMGIGIGVVLGLFLGILRKEVY